MVLKNLAVLFAIVSGLVLFAGILGPTSAKGQNLASPTPADMVRNTLFRNYLPVVIQAQLASLPPSHPTATPVPQQTNTPTAGGDPVIVAAGDIACDPATSAFNGGKGTSYACRELYTSDVAMQQSPAAALVLGDTQYEVGALAAFQQSYDPSWGRLKSITHPAVGNHEYLTANASGYYGYFGAAAGAPNKGYYSFDLGAWHLIALNSQCSSIGGCGPGSPQDTWLRADLAAHPNKCTLAYWHIPLWSSGGRASPNMAVVTQDLYAAHADVVLTGHDHIYERFAPQDAKGNADPVNGIRAFVVGTGGADHTTVATIAKNSEVRNVDTFGVLKLTLHSSSYDWQFVPEPGGTFTDSGSQACH